MQSIRQIIKGTIDGLINYENSNFINGECIICTHKSVSTHKDTRLSSWKNGVIKPILRDFDFGLEDAYWLQNINGYDWLWAEKKPYNDSQRNISFFRAISGTHDWKFLYDIKPTSNYFEKASVSSPTVKYENSIFKMVYEGRSELVIPGVDDYHIGYLEINPTTLKIFNRSTKPIIEDRLVPDDYGNKISGHRQDIPREGLWLSVVYKKSNGKWIKDYEPKIDDKRVEEFYFNGYYYKEQYGGMWKWKESRSPTNGEKMKPQRLLFDGKILSCDDIPTASRFDAYATGGFQYDLISSRFSRFNNRVNFMNIADKFIKGKDQEFWIVSEVNGIKYISDRLKFGEPEPPEPNNNEVYKANIRSLLSEIDNKMSEIYVELDKIK